MRRSHALQIRAAKGRVGEAAGRRPSDEVLKILVLEPEYLDAEAMKILGSVGKVTARRMPRAEMLKAIPQFDIVITRVENRMDREVLCRATRLKAIGSTTTGLNHIDTEYAMQRGIKVFNLHGTHTVPTAQHAFGLMLSLARKIPWAYENLREGRWERHRFLGSQLDGKTLGIIGLGRIGKTVCGYAKAFGMNVIYYDPYVSSNMARKVSLRKLLSSSDIITVHASLNRSSSNALSDKEVGLIKKGALLINTARAEIIDYDALLLALKSGRLAGAAIDVFEHEPVSSHERDLLRYAKSGGNLIVTPHIAGSTREAAHNSGVEIATEIAREFGGRK